MKTFNKEKNMTTQFTPKRASQILFIGLITVCCAVILAPVHAQRAGATKAKSQYQVSKLPDFGGTSSGGNCINDQSWVAGYSRLPDRNRHATLWRSGLLSDLGTLGGPNSSVTWNVKNTQVLQFRPAMSTLGTPDQIHELPLIPGDTSGAATAINDNGQIVGISGICDQAVGRHTAKHAVLWENGGVTDIYPDAPAPWCNTP